MGDYKQHVIKDYFINYIRNRDNISVDLKEESVVPISGRKENWKVTLVDTGDETLTAGRILKVRDYIGDEPFHRLVEAKEMDAYCHEGFWSPMDNIHDRDYLEKVWQSGEAPWR